MGGRGHDDWSNRQQVRRLALRPGSRVRQLAKSRRRGRRIDLQSSRLLGPQVMINPEGPGPGGRNLYDSADTAQLQEALRKGLLQADPSLSRFNPLQRIIFHDDFDTGTSGWSELVGNYGGSLNEPNDPYSALIMDCRPPMLSSLSMWDSGTVGGVDGNYALKIATRPRAGHISIPVKRVTRGGSGLLQFEAWYVFKSEASRNDLSPGTEEFFGGRHDLGVPWDAGRDTGEAGGDTALRSFGFLFDLQDREERWWPGIRYLHAIDGQLVERWQWHAGGVRQPHLDGWVDIEDGDQRLCYNEIPTKHNWHYLRWQVDLSSREYVELQSNGRTWDLRGKRYEYRSIHRSELSFVPLQDGLHPHIPAAWNMLNVEMFVEAGEDRRAFLYVDSDLLSAEW